MKDNNNLKNKLKEYKYLLILALQNNNPCDISFYNNEIRLIQNRLGKRLVNRKKNEKQFKKANGFGIGSR